MLVDILMHLYYFCVTTIIVHELQCALKPKRAVKLRRFINRYPNHIHSKTIRIVTLYILIIVLIGLMTSQWVLFLTYLLISIFSGVLQTSFKRSAVITFIDCTICSILLLFLVLNKYHFHLTATEIFNLIF